MAVDNGVRVVAGGMLLLSLLLTAWVHPQCCSDKHFFD